MSKIAWFIVGLILGAALGLFVATLTQRHERQEPVASDTAAVAPAATETAPAAAPVTATPAPGSRVPRAAPTPRVRDNTDEQAQVAEDAAAVGMTTKSRRPAPDAAAPAPAPSETPPAPDETPG
jgi:hypothetical protein